MSKDLITADMYVQIDWEISKTATLNAYYKEDGKYKVIYSANMRTATNPIRATQAYVDKKTEMINEIAVETKKLLENKSHATMYAIKKNEPDNPQNTEKNVYDISVFSIAHVDLKKCDIVINITGQDKIVKNEVK